MSDDTGHRAYIFYSGESVSRVLAAWATLAAEMGGDQPPSLLASPGSPRDARVRAGGPKAQAATRNLIACLKRVHLDPPGLSRLEAEVKATKDRSRLSYIEHMFYSGDSVSRVLTAWATLAA